MGREICIIVNKELINPSVDRRVRWKKNLTIQIALIAESEYFSGLPALEVFFEDLQDLRTSSEIQKVMLPRLIKDLLYSDQFEIFWLINRLMLVLRPTSLRMSLSFYQSNI